MALTEIPIHFFILLLIFLILLSAFFSASETGMMAINRYRLRHLARKGNPHAERVVQLLKRPDRLLGVILIGNTFSNIMASAVATIIAVHFLGRMGVVISTILLTMIILIFAEATPKTFAAMRPRMVAFAASWPLKTLLVLFYPLVWFINAIANGILWIFGVRVKPHTAEPLTTEELRTVVRETTSKISSSYQQMLLRILSLSQMTVEDVMIPRQAISGIDVTDSWDKILHELMTTEHNYVPLYRENIDQVIGMLNVRRAISPLTPGELNKDKLVNLVEDVYFIPEVTLLPHQIVNFQQEHKKLGLVVDEYGDIQGLVALEDILEEIVGELSLGVDVTARLVQKQNDGSYLVDGRINIRDLNRMTDWNLPVEEGPKTLSGLIVEYLETIPVPGVALRLSGYPMEIIKVSGNTVRSVRVWPDQWSASTEIQKE